MRISDIDWDSWNPTEDAVITYIIRDDEVLLIHKKTGLGAGKVNAPGGHIEQGETALEAAVRETREEVGLDTSDLIYSGELYFHFLDGLRLKGTVYLCRSFSGELIETDEALPFWCGLGSIPWDKMWEDDIHWLPRALEGDNFEARFIFEKEKMLDMDILFFN